MKAFPALIMVLLVGGCSDKDDIRVYLAPKEGPPPAVSGPEQSASQRAPSLIWTVPSSWAVRPPSGLRLASFVAGNADISVVSFPGEAGGDLANVNRWRGQLELGPWSESELSARARSLESSAGKVLVVEFASARKGSLIAARLKARGWSWFFKITGPAEEISRVKPSFESFLGSLDFEKN